MSESSQVTTQQGQKEETAKKWQPYWKLVGFGAPLFWAIGIGFVIAGFNTVYDVKSIFEGDAYNYIVAANRGIGLIGVGIAAFILGSADAIINTIRKSSVR